MRERHLHVVERAKRDSFPFSNITLVITIGHVSERRPPIVVQWLRPELPRLRRSSPYAPVIRDMAYHAAAFVDNECRGCARCAVAALVARQAEHLGSLLKRVNLIPLLADLQKHH